MKKELSQEEKDLMPIVAKEWVDVFHNNTSFNVKNVVDGVKWVYTDLCKLKEPIVFVMDNPMYCQLLANMIKSDNVRANVRDNVWANVRDNVMDNVWDNVRDNVWGDVSANVWANVRDNVMDNVGANVSANVMDNVWANVRDNVWDNVRDNVWGDVSANVSANVRDNVMDNVGANVGDNVMDNVGANVGDNVGANVGDNVMDNVEDNVWNNVRNNVRDNVWDNVWNNVRNNVRDNVMDNVGANVGDNVMDNVWANVRDNVWDNVRDNVWGDVWDNVMANVKYEEPSGYVNYSDSGWVSFYDYFARIGVLKDDKFNRYRDLIKEGVYYSIFLDGIAIVSRPPVSVVQNNTDQLHNVNGASVLFKGYNMFSVNGRTIERELIEKPITFEQFQKEQNEDVKAAMITIIKERNGNEGLLKFLGAECVDERVLVHESGRTETIKLHKTKESYSFLQDRNGNMNNPYCWSEMTCPSTGSTYLIDNSADFACAIEAVKFLRPEHVPTNMYYNWTSFTN